MEVECTVEWPRLVVRSGAEIPVPLFKNLSKLYWRLTWISIVKRLSGTFVQLDKPAEFSNSELKKKNEDNWCSEKLS